jgi:hypothetical protein
VVSTTFKFKKINAQYQKEQRPLKKHHRTTEQLVLGKLHQALLNCLYVKGHLFDTFTAVLGGHLPKKHILDLS